MSVVPDPMQRELKSSLLSLRRVGSYYESPQQNWWTEFVIPRLIVIAIVLRDNDFDKTKTQQQMTAVGYLFIIVCLATDESCFHRKTKHTFMNA